MLLSLIIALTLTACVCGENPALQFTLTDKGLQYGKHVAAGWIQDMLDRVSLPDITGGILGMKYTLTGVTISKCDFPEPSVEFYQDAAGLKTSVLGLSVALTGGWQARFGLIHGGGMFSVALFDVNVVSVAALGKDADGHLTVSSVSCTAQVRDIMMQCQGGPRWIIRKFLDFFKGRIKGEIEGKICHGVEQSIVSLEHHLQAMNVSFDVGRDLAVNISLTSVPLINATSLNLGFKGEFYSIETHEDPPFEAQPFTLPEQPGFMFSAGVSAYTLNSAAYGFFSAGLLEALINDSMIPPSSPIHLNTSTLGPFIPQLPKLFPDLLMNLKVYARDTPMFYLQPGLVKLNLLGAVKAFAILPNSTLIPLFKLNADSNFSAEAWISDGKLKGKVAMDNFTLTLEASEVGPFKTDRLENMVKMGITIGLTRMNEILAAGLDLPRMMHGELLNTVLSLEEGFLAFSSDAEAWPAREHGHRSSTSTSTPAAAFL